MKTLIRLLMTLAFMTGLLTSCLATIAVHEQVNHGPRPEPAYQVLYPFTIVFDVVTFPFQYVWLMFNWDKV